MPAGAFRGVMHHKWFLFLDLLLSNPCYQRQPVSDQRQYPFTDTANAWRCAPYEGFLTSVSTVSGKIGSSPFRTPEQEGEYFYFVFSSGLTLLTLVAFLA